MYGHKMAPVSSTAVNSAVPSYATYGSRQGENIFDSIHNTAKQSSHNFNMQMSDIFGSNQNSSLKQSSGYDLLNYSSTNPFLQNYTTDTIEEENIVNGEGAFSSNLFGSSASGGGDLLGPGPGGSRRGEELTPTSSAGTEDSRPRDALDRDIDGDGEQSD